MSIINIMMEVLTGPDDC